MCTLRKLFDLAPQTVAWRARLVKGTALSTARNTRSRASPAAIGPRTRHSRFGSARGRCRPKRPAKLAGRPAAATVRGGAALPRSEPRGARRGRCGSREGRARGRFGAATRPLEARHAGRYHVLGSCRDDSDASAPTPLMHGHSPVAEPPGAFGTLRADWAGSQTESRLAVMAVHAWRALRIGRADPLITAP